MTEIYRTTVTAAGDEATAFIAEGMFVTFGENAPDALRDFCFIVEQNATTGPIEPGQELLLDGRRYPITAVGDVARQNLDGLGHVTFKFDGSPGAQMHGSVHVAGGDVPPSLEIGSTIVIEAP